jgi:hypothetical protein
MCGIPTYATVRILMVSQKCGMACVNENLYCAVLY